jgi:hypothetical protein
VSIAAEMAGTTAAAPSPPPPPERAAARSRRQSPLTLVPSGQVDARRAPFVAVVVVLLVAGLLVLLVLNTVLARDAFTLHSLKIQDRVLTDREQALQREVERLRAPQELAAAAIALGMVQSGPPAFLRLPDGAVLGTPVPAEEPVEAAPKKPVRR